MFRIMCIHRDPNRRNTQLVDTDNDDDLERETREECEDIIDGMAAYSWPEEQGVIFIIEEIQ